MVAMHRQMRSGLTCSPQRKWVLLHSSCSRQVPVKSCRLQGATLRFRGRWPQMRHKQRFAISEGRSATAEGVQRLRSA